MKHAYSKFIVSLIFIFFHFNQFRAEGFAAGTLIKVPDGYAKIEDLQVGDSVICFDAQKNYVESAVTYAAQKTVDRYVRIAVADEKVRIACNQRLYDKNSNSWMIAQELCCNAGSVEYAINGELVASPLDLYLIGVAEYHNFIVSKSEICAHNFFPPIVLAISLAFGSGSLEIAGISAGIAGLGSFLGYQWHKKNKQKHNFVVQPQGCGGGMMPEDPEEEKRRKRDEAREEHRPLTNKEAQKIAEQCGHRKVQSHPCGNTRNKPVFFNGKNYISPDADGHNGGLWKVFDRRGKILHTASRRFEKIVKNYE